MYCKVVYILIYALIIIYNIYSKILSWNITGKKSGHVGTRTCVASLSQETCFALHHHASPKKDASSPE